MSLRKIFLLLPLLIFFTASSSQILPDTTKLSLDSVLSKVSDRLTEYKTLSAKAKISWSDDEAEQEFMSTIRSRKDSLIWMSLGIMGIEGARVLATPDSFRLLNKLANEFVTRDFNFLQNWILFPVNFNMLQEIIAGGKISIDEKVAMISNEDSSSLLYLESDKLLEKIWVDTSHYTICKILLKDKLLKQDMTISFEAYNYSEAKPFSYKRSILINRDTRTAKLDIEFLKINFDGELTYPFDVSEKYKRVE